MILSTQASSQETRFLWISLNLGKIEGHPGKLLYTQSIPEFLVRKRLLRSVSLIWEAALRACAILATTDPDGLLSD